MVGKGQTSDEDESPNMNGGRITWLAPVLFLFSAVSLTFVAYFRSLNGPMVLDDQLLIYPSKLDAILHNIPFRVRFVSDLSFALNYRISDMNPAFFRLTNIILHIFSGGLAFSFTWVTLRLPSLKFRYSSLKDGEIPFFISSGVAVLFLLHPIQTSTVNYITQRAAIMACMFSFAGFIFYVKGALSHGKQSFFLYVLSAVFFLLAVFSKENAVMVLLMLPLYDFFFLSSFQWREFRKRFITLSVLMISLAAVVAYTMGIARFMEKIITLLSNPNQPIERYAWGGKDLNWTPIEYLLTELRVVSKYILLILVPVPSLMVFDYSNAYPVSHGLFHPISTIASLFFLLSLLFLSVRFMRKTPLISFGILWYLVTISLESFIALGLDPYFEHRNYLPSFGLFLSLASLPLYVDRSRIRIKKEIPICLVAIFLSFLTFTRNGVWTKGELLWKDAVEKSPNNLRGLISLSSIYIVERRFHEAEDYLKRASAVEPMTAQFRLDILLNQASVYKQTNRRKEALSILKALEAENGFEEKNMRTMVYYYIGEVLREEEDFPEAKEYLEKAYQKMRQRPEVLISLGLVSKSLGERDAAEGYFKKAMELAPANGLPYVELGDLYFMENDMESAEKNYREAVAKEAGPAGWKARAMFGIAQIKLIKGEINEGKRLFQEVVMSAPDFYPPYIFLGGIYLKENNPDEALAYLGKALSLKKNFLKNEPNTKLLYFYLGKAYLEKGDKKLAGKNFGEFLSMAAGDKRLEKQYGRARAEWARIRE